MIFWLGYYLFFFSISVLIGLFKGHLIAGVLLGYVLGSAGVVLMYLSKDRKQVICSHCNASINITSYLCPECKTKQLRI
jgi:ribosomal protein L40E